jgi:hypothetical protein
MALCRSLIWLAIGFVAVGVWATFVYAHGGGLDTYGCHHNRKAGGYHCHRGALAGQSFSSKDEMLRHLKEEKSGSETETRTKRR